MTTKYERAWDKYSREWTNETAGDAGGPLGAEWGDDALTRRVLDEFLRPALRSAAPTRPEHDRATVLEVGPGGGKYSALIAPDCGRLICADVSSEMLERTRRRLKDVDHLVTHKLDGIDLGGIDDASIDVVFAIDVFIHLDAEDVYAYLREFLRVLRPGGHGVLHFASFESFAGWHQFVREADLNRAEYKQIGRISFFTPAIVEQMITRLGFDVERLATDLSPRDIFVAFRKPAAIADESAPRRVEAIRARAGATGSSSDSGGSDSGGSSLVGDAGAGQTNVARDFLAELAHSVRVAPESRYIQRAEITLDGDRRDVLLAHPPALVGFALTVPVDAVLVTAIAIHPDYHGACCPAGVDFRIGARCGVEVTELASHRLDPVHRDDDRCWRELSIDLSAYAGKVVFLTFETAIPTSPNEGNLAAFAEPAILSVS